MIERNASKRKVFQILRTILCFTLLMRSSIHADKGCREQLQNEIVEASECETICRRSTNNRTQLTCELRLLVILPNQPWQYEASLTRVS